MKFVTIFKIFATKAVTCANNLDEGKAVLPLGVLLAWQFFVFSS